MDLSDSLSTCYVGFCSGDAGEAWNMGCCLQTHEVALWPLGWPEGVRASWWQKGWCGELGLTRKDWKTVRVSYTFSTISSRPCLHHLMYTGSFRIYFRVEGRSITSSENRTNTSNSVWPYLQSRANIIYKLREMKLGNFSNKRTCLKGGSCLLIHLHPGCILTPKLMNTRQWENP